MQKSTKSKRKKLKSFTLTPVSAPLLSPAGSSTSWQAAARGVAVQAVSSLKRTLDGSLKLVSHRIVGTTEPAPGVVEDKRPTVEEVLSGFLKQSEELGWDQGYTDSFIESGTDFAEIELDPESDKRKRETGQGDRALHRWTKEIDGFLRALITLEGRTAQAPSCRACGAAGAGDYRCMVCDNHGLLCAACMMTEHRFLPLHRMQKWNGEYFEKVSLKSMGFRVQLGHPCGSRCPLPQQAWGDDFLVIDVDAVHTLSVNYCGCGATSNSQVQQLLERRWYPATVENPKTAASFRVLELFEILQYESKVSPFELWKALSRLTDNTGLAVVKDRYPSFLRMVHEWRHLKMLKRAGRGHDPERDCSQTREGECALLCPACPHPGINMPEGWEDEPAETKYIHAINLAMDACFRLKREAVSSETADPGLSRGYSYYVEQEKFKAYIDEHKDEVEPKSTCSRHDAVNLQDVSAGQGYSSTGVATVECARHNMKRPSAVCDLQKGERYCNMDFIVHLWFETVASRGIFLGHFHITLSPAPREQYCEETLTLHPHANRAVLPPPTATALPTSYHLTSFRRPLYTDAPTQPDSAMPHLRRNNSTTQPSKYGTSPEMNSIVPVSPTMNEVLSATDGLVNAIWYTGANDCDYPITLTEAVRYQSNIMFRNPPPPPVAARICIIGLICSADFQLHPGDDEPTAGVGQCQLFLRDPHPSDDQTDFERGWRHLHMLMHAIAPTAGDVPFQTVLPVHDDTRLIALSHTLFQPKGGPDGTEMTDNVSDDFDQAGFTIADWPTSTIAARNRLDAMRDSHYAVPIRAYDSEHSLIPPADYDRQLLGAEVCAEFTLYHARKPNGDHAFSAYMDSISVLDDPIPRSPDISLPTLRNRDLPGDE